MGTKWNNVSKGPNVIVYSELSNRGNQYHLLFPDPFERKLLYQLYEQTKICVWGSLFNLEEIPRYEYLKKNKKLWNFPLCDPIDCLQHGSKVFKIVFIFVYK